MLFYRMPWRRRSNGHEPETGSTGVRSGVPYAIEVLDSVLPAVRSVALHLFIVIADVSGTARWTDRLVTRAMDESRASSLRVATIDALEPITHAARFRHVGRPSSVA